ncbi:efflux RND transporter permease subunit [Anaerovorax odorimutans]|uniref:efflux RND transporter permease subunit n=1 Tax=Anaerovorax odorimutans TaxID=109327 RepID=UPI00040692E1|nr:efflux RND transporter permease subunit [Anaerovorax odorimutans]
MNLSNLAIKRPVASIMLMLIVILVGTISLIGLPQDLMPKMELPIALVMVDYPNASPEEVENMVTKPIEQALASVENLDTLYSMTSQGTAIAFIKFQNNTDMNFATLNMREKIAMISDYLPDECSDPMVLKMDMNAAPVVQVYVSGDIPLSSLNNEIDDNISSYFEKAAGVASVNVYGGIEKEISLSFDQEKLMGYGLSLSSISQILSAENINRPSGDITKGSKEIIVRTMGEFDSVDDIKNLPVSLTDRSVIHLQDIANIEDRYKEQDSISRVDGQSSIAITITKQSDANTVDVSDEVHKQIKKLEKKYPDLNFVVGFDQADFIKSSISSVSQSAITGAILAAIVIFLFLKNISTTMIISISIPTSILATFALMKLRGMTLNMITLCALTLAVGMLVDNSVVVLENIFRIRQETETAEEAAILGSKEIIIAVTASTLTSIVVYLPIALSNGISALMFRDFCYTIIIALIASLIVSLTVVPMLCSRVLTKGFHTDYIRLGKFHYRFKLVPYFSKLINWITLEYEAFIRKSLMIRKRIIAICIVIFIVSCSLLGVVGMELLPATDEGTFKVTVDCPYGTSLADKDKIITELETYILSIPELKHCTVDIGNTDFLTTGSVNESSLSVTLVNKQDRKRSTAQVVKDVKKHFSNFVGADIDVSESSSISSMSGGADMELTIKGKELDKMEKIGEDLSKIISKIDGVSDTDVELKEGNPEVKVILNRDTAAYYGVTAYQMANTLSSSLAGTTSTKLKVSGEETEINLYLENKFGDSFDNMKQIMITTNTGQVVPVGQIAEFEFDNSPNVIYRENQQRYTTLSIDVDGRDLGSVSKDVLAKVDEYQFPEGYSYDTGGQQEEMVEAFGQLLLALVAAVLLVYFLLAAQFEALILPLIVMMSIPFAMSGAFIALFICGKSLSMTSFIGLIMLIGIVVNNSILLIEFIKQHKKTMDRNEAIVQAGKLRLRPILMTSLTTCVGMVPMSLGIGDGGEVLSPMGISIIGGLIASTLVTLILIPVLYAVVDDKQTKRKNKKLMKKERIYMQEQKWLEEEQSHGRA